MTKKGRELCERIIVPLLEQEKKAMEEMGEKESHELMRLLDIYGKKYCEGIAQLVEKGK